MKNKNQSIRNQQSPIYLVGIMGCGKTYIGQKLAAAMSFDFVDMDAYIENHFGDSILNIFDKHGEIFFRQLEHDMLVSLTDKPNRIFSTGGGAPCFHDNMGLMNAQGITMYLSVEPATIVKRIAHQRDHRPLLKNFSDDAALLNFVTNKMIERNKFYEQATYIIDANGNAHDIVEHILHTIQVR